MNEHYDPSAWKHYVRSAGQVLAMKPEAISHAVQHGTHEHFWLCVFALHLLHQVTAAVWGEAVDGLVRLPDGKQPRFGIVDDLASTDKGIDGAKRPRLR